jgi:hypothetical protein
LATLLSHLLRRVGGQRTSGGDGPGDVVVHDVTDPPEQVQAYWTDERMRAARPREQRLDPPGRED